MAVENPAVTRFRKYLQINTMHPSPDYEPAFDYLRAEAGDIGLKFSLIDSGKEGSPVGVMTWEGRQPEMKSILLSSHIDVVPVFPEFWKYDPFSAHKDERGNIFARGAQDMKCVTNWYLEAIRRLKSEGKSFPRTIHLLLTTDEEIASPSSTPFSTTAPFRDLNAAFGLDEGMASPGETVKVYYGEKSLWWIEVTCRGSPGHGSQFINNTAGPKLKYMINKFHQLRDEQEKKLSDNPEAGLGSVISVNMTQLKGGVQPNVVPSELTAIFDCRIPPAEDLEGMERMLRQWAMEAGTDVTVDIFDRSDKTQMVKLDDNNTFWTAFKAACKSSNVEIQPEIFPAGTDSGTFRKVGVDMLGFSPMNNTPILLHDHNEFLNENVFLRGIDIYYNVIASLASVDD